LRGSLQLRPHSWIWGRDRSGEERGGKRLGRGIQRDGGGGHNAELLNEAQKLEAEAKGSDAGNR